MKIGLISINIIANPNPRVNKIPIKITNKTPNNTVLIIQ